MCCFLRKNELNFDLGSRAHALCTTSWIFLDMLSSLLFGLFLCPFNLLKRICWEVYLLFTRLPPTQAWVDPREQALMVKYLQEGKDQRR